MGGVTTLELRDYQVDGIARVDDAEARGVRRQLGVAATGLGKTVIFCALAEKRGGRTLILAHRDELVSQAVAKVREMWPGVDVGIVKAGQNDVHAQVVVASVQTLARASRLAQLLNAPSSLLRPVEPFGLVVVDEAHHAAADTYRAILDGLRAGVVGCDKAGVDHYHDRPATPDEVDDGCELGLFIEPCPGPPGPLVLGVTATPDRGDGKGLSDLFDEVVFSYDILWGIRAGYLSDLRGIAVRVDGMNMGDLKVRRGDYDQGQAGALMEKAGAPRILVEQWFKHAPDRKTLVFTPTVAMANAVADEYRHAGVAAAFVHGGTPLDERRQLLRDFTSGVVQVLANCAVLTEGYDEPTVDCIVIARPTRSRALYTQMVGRGTRRHPDKADCLVLDVVGASDEHSLVTIPSLFGIDKKRMDRATTGEATMTSLLLEQDDEAIAAGRLRAEEVEMFRKVVAAGIAWVPVHTDGALRRYVRPLGRTKDGKEMPTVVLAQRDADADTWTAGIQDVDGTKRALIANVSMELAQSVAEDAVRKLAGASTALVDANAKWRKRKPSPKQKAAAKKWGVPVDPAWNAGELSDAMSARIAKVKGHGK